MTFEPKTHVGDASTDETAAGTASRRGMLLGVGLVGVAGPLVAACGGSDGDSGGGSKDKRGGSSAGAGTVLGKASDIPVGGGKIFKDQKVVVTQPSQGQFKAFSAVCTHRGCTVGQVSGDTINCPCHGSKFAIADGSVKDGPAPKPLPGRSVTVQNGDLTLG